MDAAMLAGQNERLDKLNQSIQDLAKAVDTRPTREELDRQAKRNRLKAWASGILVVAFGAGMFFQQQTISNNQRQNEMVLQSSCEDRNDNNTRFIELLATVGSITAAGDGDPNSEEKLAAAFRVYADAIKPVDCARYMTSG